MTYIAVTGPALLPHKTKVQSTSAFRIAVDIPSPSVSEAVVVQLIAGRTRKRHPFIGRSQKLDAILCAVYEESASESGRTDTVSSSGLIRNGVESPLFVSGNCCHSLLSCLLCSRESVTVRKLLEI
ncbi:hypothetical protein J6590_061621 [Homalodisca vitripennis]|nr:hypothetical protein J6590_061621 [Homalodisca vitripennis]